MLPIAGCLSSSPFEELGRRTAIDDPGTIAGSWREVRRDARRVSRGYMLSISSFEEPTFAVQIGCVVTGGLLRPSGNDTFRVERYETGFSTEGCGPWRSGPDVAPFDGTEVRLMRKGRSLVTEGGGHRVEFVHLAVPVI